MPVKTANGKWMIRQVMSLYSSEHGITREKVLAKCSGVSHFSGYLGFQSNALEFSKSQMHGGTCGARWWKKKRESRNRIPRKSSKRMNMPPGVQRGGSFGSSGFHSGIRQAVECTARPYLEISSKLRQFRSCQTWYIQIFPSIWPGFFGEALNPVFS